ncbi:MAG: penicillin-binding protein 2 [Candidatus Colwellbacteria bacterium]|nr:penicillin-binding protein 2 [Candidatus Colwellbacteria bacterium]
MGLRITVLVGIFALLYGALGFRMYDLQLRQGEALSAKAASIHELAGKLTPKRGSVYFTDKDGGRIPAGINKDYPSIYAIPKEVTDPQGAAGILAGITGKNESELVKILSKEDDPYEPLVKKATDEQVALLKKYDLKGIYIGDEPARFYLLGRIASHLVGFTSIVDDAFGLGAGQYGVESQYNKELTGRPGKTRGDRLLIKPKNGEDIYLTIDRNIQVQAESILSRLISQYGAVGGTVIVMEPKTGKVLAMLSKPDFDPNSYGHYEINTFLNPSVQSVYEPGSIFKVITMSAGIDSGKITPDTTFVDPGSLTLNGKTIRNWDLKAYGKVTMTNVIEKSINTGAAFAERTTGHNIFHDYLVKFGFKESTGIDLPGEIVGSLRPLEEDVRDINYATASYGQGVSLTPIRLITAVAAIANGGVLMRPYTNAESQPKVVRRVISEETSRKVIGMMVSAVDKAQIARIPGYNVAGKTGTGFVPNFSTGGYTDEVINTYIGFAPAYDPQFIILIRLDKPAGGPLAGLTVVPAFRELAEFIINYYSIPPDNL